MVLISPLGGPERPLTEVHLREGIMGGSLSWSPDGRALAMVDEKEHDPCPNLVLYMMETGEKRPLTKPPETSFGDGCPAISPDGRTLAFRRWVAWHTGDLFLLDLSQDLKPIGEPRRLTFQGLDASGPAWVSDRSALVYSAGDSLWRVAASGASQPKKLSFIGQDAYQPAISQRGSRLAYTYSRRNTGSIWRVAIPSPKGKTNPPTRLIASTRWQYLPQYSPDGTKIAFTSTRSGTAQIWVCNADGSNALQLTHFGERGAVGPDWSPDGRRLTFSLDVGGHNEVYVINANGENPRRLTFSSVSDNASWSRDGKWIYFDDPEGIMKVSPEGGQAIRVAKNRSGYYGPVESPDRKFIYVIGSGTDASNYGVWRFPREGGEPRQVLDWIREYRSYAVVDDGIYFIPRADPTEGYSIQFLDMATGHVRKVAELGKHPSMHLSVSSDRHWALYEQDEQHISELMLVESFR